MGTDLSSEPLAYEHSCRPMKEIARDYLTQNEEKVSTTVLALDFRPRGPQVRSKPLNYLSFFIDILFDINTACALDPTMIAYKINKTLCF